ncbi:hypothetical protein Tco_1065028 [Tanacetum coccineum]
MEITSVTLLRNKCPLGKGYGDGSNHQGGNRGGSIALEPKVVMKVCGWFLGGDKVVTSQWIMVEGGWLLGFGLKLVPTGRVKVPTGRVKVPAGRYVVPTSKDKFIVSAGRTKVIPTGSTILVLVVLCLLRVDSKGS